MTHPIESSPPSMYQYSGRFAGAAGRRRKQLMLIHRAFDAPFDALQAARLGGDPNRGATGLELALHESDDFPG